MSVGICIMSHHHLYRVEELARHFTSAGCKVVIHVDLTAPKPEFENLQSALSDTDAIFAPRKRCEWGTFSLHDAALESARLLINTFDDVKHVTLVSGSCLPIQSVKALQSFLNGHPDTDFVESRLLGVENWVQEGLSEERFTLYFPFGWRSKRWLFDRTVDLQRRLRIRRKAPDHLQLALGSQWWTLSRGTLRRILEDPLKPKTDAYFRKCWIVDESYVQTLVRTHARKHVNRSLCFTEFDPQGKPFTFYDDHAHLLQEQTDKFFARKIWHGATGLYNKYLYGVEPLAAARRPKGDRLADLVTEGRAQRCEGRPGLLMQSRFPVQAFERQHSTARPYIVLDGYDFLFKDIDEWQRNIGLEHAHGRLFRKDAVEFMQRRDVMPGGMVASAKIRDWNTEQFLTNLIWNNRKVQQSFQFHVSDSTRMASFLLKDPNATILMIKGAWVLSMAPREGETSTEFRRRAKRFKLLEKKHLDELEQPTTRATVLSWTLAEVIADPSLPLNALRSLIEQPISGSLMQIPELRQEHGLNELVYKLQAEGIQASESGLHTKKRRKFLRIDTA